MVKICWLISVFFIISLLCTRYSTSPLYTLLQILTRDQPDRNYPYPDCMYEELNAGERVCSLGWLLLKTEMTMTEVCAVLISVFPTHQYSTMIFKKVNVVNVHYATPGHSLKTVCQIAHLPNGGILRTT